MSIIFNYKSINAGDTIKYEVSLPEYPANVWTLRIVVISQETQYIITATNNNNNHSILVPSNTTKNWLPGQYDWVAIVTNGTERYQIESGQVEIKPDLLAATSGYDTRSQAKRILDAIEATLEGKVSRDAMQISIGGQTIIKHSPEQLIALREYYKKQYELELRKDGKQKARNIIRAVLK